MYATKSINTTNIAPTSKNSTFLANLKVEAFQFICVFFIFYVIDINSTFLANLGIETFQFIYGFIIFYLIDVKRSFLYG